MSKFIHTPKTLRITQGKIKGLATRLMKRIREMEGNGIENLDVNYEASRTRGLNDLEDWLGDVEKKLKEALREIEDLKGVSGH